MSLGKFGHLTGQEPRSEAFRHTDPQGAVDRQGAARRLPFADSRRRLVHRLDPGEQTLARLGQDLALAGLLEQGDAKARFQPPQPPSHGGGIDAHRAPRAGQLPGAGDGKEGLEIAPVGGLHICRS